MGLRLWVGVNVVVKLLVGVEVWVRSRRWLMVCVLIRRLWVVGVVVGHDGRRVWLWRREGWTIMSAPTAARCARVMPVVERGCRSGDWVRTRVRGWRWTFRGDYATEDKTETMYVGIAVGIVLHGGCGGLVGDVVRHYIERIVDSTR